MGWFGHLTLFLYPVYPSYEMCKVEVKLSYNRCHNNRSHDGAYGARLKPDDDCCQHRFLQANALLYK